MYVARWSLVVQQEDRADDPEYMPFMPSKVEPSVITLYRPG